MLRHFSAVLILLIAIPGISSCKDEKTKTCEAAWKRIQQCLPQFSENKEMHLKVCRETFEKSSTRGTNRCAASFSNCEQFKKCLSYGARCRDYEGKEFDNCLTAAPTCADYNAAEFKHCIACVQAGQEKALDKCVQGRVKAARAGSEAEEEETPPPMAPAADSMAPPADPMAPPADPMAPAADSMAPAADPMAPAADSMAPPADPMAPPADPMAPPADPMAPAADMK